MKSIPNYSLFSLAFPIAIEFLFQRLFGIADTMVLGNYADNAVAAVGYADQILSISLLIFQIISSGTSILLAQAIGARKKDLQKDICSASLVLSLLFGSITCIALLMLRIPLLKLLNVSAELQIHAADYLQIMAFSQFFPADTFKTILQLGIPAAGESCSYKFSQLIGTTIIGSLGADILTGKIYGMTFSSVMVLIPDSIAIATGVLVGVSAGENDFKRANSIVLSSIKKGAMAIVLVDISLLLLGRYIINTFYTDNPLIQNTAYFVLCAEALTMFIKNFNLNLGNSLRAIKDVHYPVLISIISMWIIGTGLCWILGVPLGYGIIGIFITFFLDESLRAYLLFRRWRQKISVH